MIQNGLEKYISSFNFMHGTLMSSAPQRLAVSFNIFTIISAQMLFHINPFRGKKMVCVFFFLGECQKIYYCSQLILTPERYLNISCKHEVTCF